MRRFLFAILLGPALAWAAGPGAVPGPDGPPPLLATAVGKSAADAERWAYTQTVVNKDHDGRVKEEVVVRYDPSQPFEQQWTPLTIDGRAPTEHQLRKYRQDHAERRKSRRALGELLDLAKATEVGQAADTVTYEVPLLQNGNQRLPPDKFRVTVRVNKERQVLENVAVRLRAALRVALVLKLKSGEADLDFAPVDPQFAPPITALNAEGEGSILFIKVGGIYTATRTDFKRVTPYSERFKVKLGEMKFLDY